MAASRSNHTPGTMASRGRGSHERELNEAAAGLDTPHQVQVLEQADRGNASDRLQDASSREDRLVPVGQAQNRYPQPDTPLDNAQGESARPLEAEPKRTSRNAWVFQRAANGPGPARRKPRVCVEEQAGLSRSVSKALLELPCTPRPGIQ